MFVRIDIFELLIKLYYKFDTDTSKKYLNNKQKSGVEIDISYKHPKKIKNYF